MGPRLEAIRELAAPQIRLPEFVLFHVGIVDPVYAQLAERDVVRLRRSLVMAESSRLIGVLIQDPSRRNDHVHDVVHDKIPDHPAKAGRVKSAAFIFRRRSEDMGDPLVLGMAQPENSFLPLMSTSS